MGAMNANADLAATSALSREFIAFACELGVLRFGEFKTKAGRLSPYFFNAGLFNDGASLARLSDFYAKRIRRCRRRFRCPVRARLQGHSAGRRRRHGAWPGTAATCLYAYNRKEAKDHGEGGSLVGAPLKGRVLIIDDVISAGTSVRESVELIRAAGATPAGVLIALDRQERGQGELSAVQEVARNYGIPVFSVASLTDLIDYLSGHPDLEGNLAAVRDYRARYGVD
jgi:orotate phosphoribosyltransferase